MNLDEIKEKLTLLEDKCINNYDDHFVNYLMTDYYEGGHECNFESGYEEWYLNELLEDITEIFFAFEPLKLVWAIESPLAKRLIKCKLYLDRRIEKKGLLVEFYTGVDPYDREFGDKFNKSENGISFIRSESVNELTKIHEKLNVNQYVTVTCEEFIDCFTGKRKQKILWLKTLNSLAVFADLIKPFLNEEYSSKHFAVASLLFLRKGKEVTNKSLSSAYTTISAEKESKIKDDFRIKSSTR